MTQVFYKGPSPYFTTPQINNIVPYLDFWDATPIVPTSNDTFYLVTATYQHRPDLLSYDIYGTTGYWWVFASRNPDTIKDPIYDLVAGINIYLPAKSGLPSYGS
jgi:hypothetical protein